MTLENCNEIKSTEFGQEDPYFGKKSDYSVVNKITPDVYSKEQIIKSFSWLTAHSASELGEILKRQENN